MQSQITQTASQISLAVKKDGVESCGLKIDGDNDTTTLFGSKIVIDGDLDVRGLTTENVTILERDNQHPIVINMGILQNTSVGTPLKSVQIKAMNQIAATAPDSENPGFCQMVVLPFYDEFVGKQVYSGDNWWYGSGGGQGIMTCETWNTSDSTSPLFGSFTLFTKSGYDDSKTRIVPWKENGTRLTIANEIDLYARNWKAITGTGYKDPTTNWLARRAVLVCADARIVSSANIVRTSSYPFIGTYMKESSSSREQNPSGNVAVNDSGRFSCGGYMSRFIILLPGQTLQLRSQIISMRGRKVLNWVVENPTEFSPINNFPIELLHYSDYQDDHPNDGLYLKGPSSAAFTPTDAQNATCDVILGASVLTKIMNIGLATYNDNAEPVPLYS